MAQLYFRKQTLVYGRASRCMLSKEGSETLLRARATEVKMVGRVTKPFIN